MTPTLEQIADRLAKEIHDKIYYATKPFGIDKIKYHILSDPDLQQMAKDRERLDWLQTHLDAIKIDCNLAFDEPFVITFERSVVGYNKRAGFKGATLHETIDKFIAQQKKERD